MLGILPLEGRGMNLCWQLKGWALYIGTEDVGLFGGGFSFYFEMKLTMWQDPFLTPFVNLVF